jgi:hypothetical protein
MRRCASATLDLAWDALPGTLTFEAYSGIDLAGSKAVNMREPGNTSLSIAMPAASGEGITRLTVRFEIDPEAVFGKSSLTTVSANIWSNEAAIRILRATYTSLADTLIYAGAAQRCKNGSMVGPPGSDATGKLAFLPNHDYEVVVTTAVRVQSKDQGPRETMLSEAFYFRTKGLPGLNAAPNVGDDIRTNRAYWRSRTR